MSNEGHADLGSASERLMPSEIYSELMKMASGIQEGRHADLERLYSSLKNTRSAMSVQEWKAFCGSFKREFDDIWSALTACSMTGHASNRPRGYPGDAELIDYIYSQNPGICASELGRRIYACTSDRPASRAVRNRRDVLTKYIDEILTADRKGRVLSLACGHAREVLASAAIRAGDVEFLAMDQDEVSVAEVRRSCSGLPVQAQVGTVRQWLKGEYEQLNGFDLAYACGLYDYLDQQVGAALSARLFGSLRSGGKLLIPNFLPDVPDVGYMECCMDWWLVYRDEAAMRELLADIPPEQIAGTRTFIEPAGNIIFLEVRKA